MPAAHENSGEETSLSDSEPLKPPPQNLTRPDQHRVPVHTDYENYPDIHNGAWIPPQSPIYRGPNPVTHSPHAPPTPSDGNQHPHQPHPQDIHSQYNPQPYPSNPQYPVYHNDYPANGAKVNTGQSPPMPLHSLNPTSPIHQPNALGKGDSGFESEGGYQYAPNPAGYQLGYPIQIHPNTETVIMEVLQGMQITVPAPDGNSLQTIHGPTHIRMPIPANSSPPIQAPPNYQIMMKMEWELDPTNGHSVPIKVFSVVPLQNFTPYQHPGGYPSSSHQEAPFPSPPGIMPPGLTETTIAPGLGETDEEKNKIKILLGHIEAPEVVSVGTNWVDLKWNQLNKSENFKEPVSYLCEIQCMNKDQSTTPTWDIKYQGRELRYRIECLIPGSEYLSRVKARYQNITGNESAAVSFKTETGKPDRPERPLVTSLSKEKLSIKWKAPSDNGDAIRDYTLEMASGQNRQADMKKIYIGKNTAYTFGEKKTERLRPGSTYRFRVRASNSHGQGSFSDEIEYKTQQPSLPTPQNFKVTERTSTSIKLEWARDQLRHLIYKLQMSDDSQCDPHDQSLFKFTNIYEGKENWFKATGLKRHSKYKFRLQTSSENGSSPFTSVIEETTQADAPPQLYKPGLKRIWKMEPNETLDEANQKRPGPFYKAELTWKAPKDTGGLPISEYRLQQRIADRNQSWELKYGGKNELTVVDNLPPGSRIEFRVQAISPAGPSVWSLPELVTTKPGKPKPPKKINIDDVGTSEAIISWSVGLCVAGGAVLRYEIQLKNKIDSELNNNDENTVGTIERPNQDKQARHCTLKNLIPGNFYRVYIRTVNSATIDSDWNYQDFETKSDIPNPPDNISVTAVQSQMVSIAWKAPSDNGSMITGYEVEVCSGTSKSIQYTQPSQLTFEHSNLNANTEYTFRVAATNKIGRSGFSPRCTIRTLASSPHIPILSAKLLYNIPVVRQQAQLKWNKPSDQGSEISGYRVECRWPSGEEEYNLSPSETELKVSDLNPSTTYRFRIQATNERGSSPFTDWTSVTSRELPPNPPVLTESEVSHNSVKLTWTQTGSRYMLQMFKTNNKNSSSWKEIYRGEKVTYRASKLLEGSVYRFRISSSNNSGDGQFSAPIEIKTLRTNPPAIKNAPAVKIEAREAIINWSQSLNGVTLSDLRYNLVLMKDSKPVESFETLNKDFRITPKEFVLMEETNYSVKVRSIRKNDDGDKFSEYSQAANFFVKKEIEQPEPTKTVPLNGLRQALPFNWHDDSVTALLLFLFAILAVLIALCGHHMH